MAEIETETETERLVRGFSDRSLPKSRWTHEAHLRVGLWHVLEYGPEEALDRLRPGIRRYNEAVGGVNSPTAGYHETITRFYVQAIARFLDRADRTRPIEDLADEVVRELGDRELPLRHWTRDRLFSAEARAAWAEPDLRALD